MKSLITFAARHSNSANRSARLRRGILAASVAALLSVTPEICRAGTFSWTGLGGDGLWDTPLNWSLGAKPGGIDDVFFPAAIPAPGAIITLTGGEAARNLAFANSYTLTGGDLTLGNGIVDVAPGAIATINSALIGSGGLTKTNAGTLTVSGRQSYAGTTYVNDGILRRAIEEDQFQIPPGGPTVVAAGASLQNAAGKTAFGSVTINGTGFGGIGALTQDPGGSSSLWGTVTVATNSTISTNGPHTRNVGGTIAVNGAVLTLTGGGSIRVGWIQQESGLPSDIVVDGAGVGGRTTLYFFLGNSYAGRTYITNGGTLWIGGRTPVGGARLPSSTDVIMDPDSPIPGSSATSPSSGGSTLSINTILRDWYQESIQSLSGTNPTSQVTLVSGDLRIANPIGTTASFAGSISGLSDRAPSGIVKDGPGTQIFTGNNSYVGTTIINAGTLGAGSTKALGNANLTINGGTLRTVGGPRIVDIGAGNILLNGGTYVANVGGPAAGLQHDQLATTGTVTLNAGTLALVQLNNYLLQPGEQVVLISGAGGVTGGTEAGTLLSGVTITGLAAFNPMLTPIVNLYPTTVVLETLQKSFAALSSRLGMTPNQTGVARAIDSAAAAVGYRTGVFPASDFLISQPMSALKRNLDLMAPEEYASIFQNGVSLNNIQTANLQRRMEDIRNEAAGLGGLNQAVPAVHSGPNFSGSMSVPDGKRGKAIVATEGDRWGTFLTGVGDFTSVGSTINASGYRFETGGVTAGVDYRVTDHLALGLSFGYANTTTSLDDGGSMDIDGGQVGIYGTYFRDSFYLDAAVGGGRSSYRARRTMPDSTVAIGRPESTAVNLFLGAGYDWRIGGLTIGPVATYQFAHATLDSFSESGTFSPVSVAEESVDSSRTSIGVHASYDWRIGRVIVRPEARASWQHEFGNTGASITSGFATLGGDAFTVAGPTVGRDSLLVSAGFSILWNDRFSTYAFYGGEVGRTNYDSNSISAGVRLRF